MARLLTFPAAHRRALEAEIALHLDRATILIARLDRLDGDCDNEDDDPAGDVLDYGEAPSDDGANISPMLPAYLADQSRGPVNFAAAVALHLSHVEG